MSVLNLRYGWKGGIGTASPIKSDATGGFTVDALVQTNFGAPEDLRFADVHVGQFLRPPQPERGSVMVVLATDAPLDARPLHRHLRACGRVSGAHQCNHQPRQRRLRDRLFDNAAAIKTL